MGRKHGGLCAVVCARVAEIEEFESLSAPPIIGDLLEINTQIGTLKFRRENSFWNAYYEEKDSLPIFFGGIALILIDVNARRREQYIALMLDCFEELIRRKYGITVDYDKARVVS